MKNVFLDLGTHYGQGLREFIQKYNMDESWVIHTFEANPNTYDIFVSDHLHHTPWVIPHLNAVSDNNDKILINIETPPGEPSSGMGSSIITLDKWNPSGCHDWFKTTAEISCINLSEFIQENFLKDDFILIKMDIEGSEYSTLSKMIETNCIDYVNKIYVEWHNRYFTESETIIKLENELIEEIVNRGVQLENWK